MRVSDDPRPPLDGLARLASSSSPAEAPRRDPDARAVTRRRSARLVLARPQGGERDSSVDVFKVVVGDWCRVGKGGGDTETR